ncbi:MAG: hypothetical protein P9M14_05350 [Candidatus Alcyoniella australis]|nr:hypothetical protein [Candidatus Alcyoniella australis]
MRSLGALLLLITVIAAGLPAAAESGPSYNLGPDDITKGLPAKDAAYDPQPGKQYGETWTLMMRSDNGAMIFAQVIISSTGFSNFFPGYSLTIIGPDGTSVTDSQEYDSQQLVASRDKLDLHFGPVLLSGQHPHYRLKINGERVSCDLEITSRGPGFSAGDGRMSLRNGKTMRICWPAPDSRIEGTLTIDGRPIDASGWGSLDHLVQTMLGPSFADSWVSFQVHAGDLDIIVLGFDANEDFDDAAIYLVLICEDGRYLAATNRVKLIRSDFAKEPYTGRLLPRRITVRAVGEGLQMDFTVSGDYIVNRMEVLEKLNPVTAAIVRTFVADPAYIRVYSKAMLNLELNGSSRTVPAEVLGQLILIK